ncbi:MarR family winged helix-turn-helix transcriptional regulator [Streptomyces sp. NPDC057939]|uniref:MarR family winged helix-turn-helix transcriptional regulator n=1 Tax=Streptomyces sp. NPDC057939 TaxID=3346284 RepID=UPI0036EF0051
MPVPEVTDEMALLVADVYEAAGVLRKSGETIAASEGQTQSRWQVLSVASGESLTVAAAARRLGVARQGVQRIANDLVHDGLATFQPNPDHRNSPLIDLTPQGRRVLEGITRRANDVHRRLAADITHAELAAARDLLRRVITQVGLSGDA